MTQSGHDRKLEGVLADAARVFADRGYHQTSMRDLARETGISLSGLYYYVKSKEELLFLIQERNFRAVVEALNESLEGATDPVEKLRRFIESHLDYFVSHMAEMKVLSHEADSLTGQYLHQVNAIKREYTRILMDILADVERVHGRAHVNRRIATYSLFGMMNWIYTWYNPLGDFDVGILSQSMLQLFLGGYVGLPMDEAAMPQEMAG